MRTRFARPFRALAALGMHSIRTKVTAITIGAIVASFAALILICFWTIRSTVEADAAEKMRLLSTNAQQSLDDYEDSVEQSVEMATHIATDSPDGLALVEAGIEQSPDDRTKAQTETLNKLVHEHCDNVQSVLDRIANHTKGIVTYYYCINPEVSTTEHGFFYSNMGRAGFEQGEPIDAQDLDPDDAEHTIWYYAPIERGRPSWVGPFAEQFLGDAPTESYVTPVYKAGVLIGVLGMDVLFSTMTTQIDTLEVYESGFACLLDSQGNVVYHPAMKTSGVQPELAQSLKHAIGDAQSSDQTAIRYKENGEEWQLAFSTLSNGMKLVITAPVREVTAAWVNLVSTIGIVALLVLAIFIPTILIAMNAVIQPLQRLTAAAQQLSDGDYSAELNYEGNDEVGTLTSAFRQMRDHLQVYISDLNSRAYMDALTGIKNQGAFKVFSARINDAIRHASDDGTKPEFAFVMFDCNKLKEINDRFGHEHGDIYLRNACRLICRAYAHSPVFRVGGDEFVALLQNQDYRRRDVLLACFDRMRDEHNASVEEPWEQVNIAKGMAVYRFGEDQSAEDVLRRADTLMYEDKRNRR